MNIIRGNTSHNGCNTNVLSNIDLCGIIRFSVFNCKSSYSIISKSIDLGPLSKSFFLSKCLYSISFRIFNNWKGEMFWKFTLITPLKNLVDPSNTLV